MCNYWARSYVPSFSPAVLNNALQDHRLILTLQDLDKDDDLPLGYEPAPAAKVFELQKREKEDHRRKDKTRQELLRKIGFEGEFSGEAVL